MGPVDEIASGSALDDLAHRCGKWRNLGETDAALRERINTHRPAPIYAGQNAAFAAVRTLESSGWTYQGGEYWKPPIGGTANLDDELAGRVVMLPPAARALVEGVLASCPVDGMPPNAPATAAVKVNHQGVVVDRGYAWQRMDTCPVAAKVQLLGGGGIAYYGAWNGRDTWPKRWAPLPKLVDGPL